MRRALVVAGLLTVALSAAPLAAEAASGAKVTYLSGRAEVLRGSQDHVKDGEMSPKAPWKPLAEDGHVKEGDAVRTGPDSRIELTLPDGSRVRLAADSQLEFERGKFRKSGERKVSFKLWIGRVWAKVAKRLGGASRFEVETRNAVAGVRGTSFTVVARADLSSVVKVYAGSVGVKKSGAGGGGGRARREVPGPHRIDKKQWEEVVATAMKQVTVSKLGQIQPAEDFVDEGDELQWAMWNSERDGAH